MNMRKCPFLCLLLFEQKQVGEDEAAELVLAVFLKPFYDHPQNLTNYVRLVVLLGEARRYLVVQVVLGAREDV